MKKLALLLLVAACGDDHHNKPDAPPVDAAPPPPRAIVVAGDYTAGHPGVLSVLDLTSRTVMQNVGPAMAVDDDPMIRKVGNELFVINRAANNITILDANDLHLVEQLGTGAASNPQDVAVVGNKLYVPTFGTKGVTVLTRGSATTTEIDLSADDPDGKPNCNSIYAVGNDLYVTCEILDNSQQFLPPRGPGKVYVVDAAANTIKTTLTLGHVNPFGLLEQIPQGPLVGGDLLIPTVNFNDGSGCIERIATKPTPMAAGCVIDNTMLGGYASRIDFDSEAGTVVMFAAVPSSDFMHAALRGFDMQTLSLWAQPLNPMAEVIGDVALCPQGVIVVTDTTKPNGGLRVYQGTTEVTTEPLPIGLGFFSAHGIVCY